MTGNILSATDNQMTEKWLRERHAAFLQEEKALAKLLKTKVCDTVEPITGLPLSKLVTFGTSPNGWPQIVIASDLAKKYDLRVALGGNGDYGYASVNAIHDLLWAHLYRPLGNGTEFRRHMRYYDESSADARRVLYTFNDGVWFAWSWHGYTWVNDACVDEDHQVNTNNLHTEIDALMGCLLSGQPYVATFVGSNSERAKHRLIETFEMTVEETRARKAEDIRLAIAAGKVNDGAKKFTEANPESVRAVIVDSIDLSKVTYPFTIQVEMNGVKPYRRIIKTPDDVWFITGNKALVEAGLMKMTVVSE